MSTEIRSRKYILSLLILISLREALVQPIIPVIRTCRDQLIQEHFIKWGHSYCFHACGLKNSGILPANDPTECTMDGDCLCAYNCSYNDTIVQQRFSFDEKLCNPPRVAEDPNPSDPDPHAHPQCISRCASKCPGGSGTICGEVEVLERPDSQERNIYTKICTCFCPVQRCPFPPLPPNNVTINYNNSNTTVVVGISESNTTTNNNVSTAVLSSTNIIKVEHLLALVLSKLFAVCCLVVKVFGIAALQAVLLGIYSSLLYGIILFIQFI